MGQNVHEEWRKKKDSDSFIIHTKGIVSVSFTEGVRQKKNKLQFSKSIAGLFYFRHKLLGHGP